MQKQIKNKIVSVEGGVYSDVTGIMRKKKVTCIITTEVHDATQEEIEAYEQSRKEGAQ